MKVIVHFFDSTSMEIKVRSDDFTNLVSANDVVRIEDSAGSQYLFNLSNPNIRYIETVP
jgi:hypothetical protein